MSATSFDQLARPVQKWIRNKGWGSLRKIQAEGIEAVLSSSDDIIIAAATAGGKTEAAFLPLVSRAISEAADEDKSGFSTVYIGPLKALINDQYQRLQSMCEGTEVPVYPWHGDVAAGLKAKAQKHPRGILLITPESLEALFVRKSNLIPRLFGRTHTFVIDELHTLLDSERGVHLRSLMARLELTTQNSIRRIGLSATLGDMEMAKAYLRSGQTENVRLIQAEGGEAELKLQLRGYIKGDDDSSGSAVAEISEHLFQHLRGSDNLVFAGRRADVETFADRLARLCETRNLPQEFYPHHASLSKDHREFVEQRLKDENKPTTAVCTSTLELGIDIGDVSCVAQIGAPFTVAALRQRLGRSGRRGGQPAVLRQYEIETALRGGDHFADQLRLGLVRSIAMIELLLENWCEPPRSQSLNLSAFVHQILSVIAEKGGASAKRLFVTLCEKGPFNNIDANLFLEVLRHIGSPEVRLIEQSSDGLLLLGRQGEKLVEHYSFYAVFQTPEEFRVECDGKTLGTLPLEQMFRPGMTIIFSGKRWEIVEINDAAKVLSVKPSRAGEPPKFGGSPGLIHDRVCEKMREVYFSDYLPVYLDETAKQLLGEARSNARRLCLSNKSVLALSEKRTLLATWKGTVRNQTLAFTLSNKGFTVDTFDGLLDVVSSDDTPPINEILEELARDVPESIIGNGENLMVEKFHPFLSRSLLEKDALSSRLDISSLKQTASDLLANESR